MLEQARHPFQDPIGLAVEPVTGDAGQLDTRELEVLVAQTVLLEGTVAAMGLEDVQFDREAQVSQKTSSSWPTTLWPVIGVGIPASKSKARNRSSIPERLNGGGA